MQAVVRAVAIALLPFLACTHVRAASDTEPVALDVYQAPVFKKLGSWAIPESAMREERDGWVDVEFMVSKQGTPYEVSVVDSFGGRDIQAAGVRAITGSSFVPATSGGEPVDAGFRTRVGLRVQVDGKSGARAPFIRDLKHLHRMVDAGDRAGADAAMARLQPRNTYEDAFRQLALYRFHSRWSTDREQLAALKAALAYESKNYSYLGKEQYATAARGLLVLYVKNRNYGEALSTWRDMGRMTPQADFSALQPLIGEVQRLSESPLEHRQPGEITTGSSWFNALFKRNFVIEVKSGEVRELRLRCEKDYLFFAYQPEVRYSVKPEAGPCRLEVVGNPGTKFEVVES